MKALLTILSCIVLVTIFIQDFRERLVSVVLFPALLILTVLWFVLIENTGIDLAKNLLFLCILFLGTTLYFSIKNKALTNLLSDNFGMGDVLFLMVITPLFAAQNMVLFIISGMTISLLTHLIVRHLNQNTEKTIPLAGYLSAYLTILFLCNLINATNIFTYPIL